MMDTTMTTTSKLPELNTLTVLLVGTQGTGKHTLAKTLIDLNKDYNLEVRIATHLPLPEDNEKTRPRIDFVVFIIDCCNLLSITSTKTSLKSLDASYFLGHVCFAVFNAQSRASKAEYDDIAGFCNAHNSPMVFGNLKDERQKTHFAGRILKLSEIAAGFAPGVSPLLVHATRHY